MESSSVCVHLQCCQIQTGIEGKQSLNRCWDKLEAPKGLAFCCQEDRCRCTFWHCKLKWPKFSFFRKVKIYSLLGSSAVWPAWKHSSLETVPCHEIFKRKGLIFNDSVNRALCSGLFICSCCSCRSHMLMCVCFSVVSLLWVVLWS